MWGGFSSDGGANQFSSMVKRQGATNPTAPVMNPVNKPSGGMTPWGQQMQQHQGGRGGFGNPNVQRKGNPYAVSPWAMSQISPKSVDQFGNIRWPQPEPATGGPNLQFPRPDGIIPPGPPGGSYGPPDGLVPRERPNDIIPPGPPGGSYGPVENRPPYIPPGPAGQSYGPSEINVGGPNPLGWGPSGPPQYQTGGTPFTGDPGPIWAPVLGGGPYNPEAKPGQITGAVPQNFGQLFPGASPLAQRILGRMPIPQQNPNPIPPGPAGQSYGPSEEFLGRPDTPGGWEWGVRNNRDRWER